MLVDGGKGDLGGAEWGGEVTVGGERRERESGEAREKRRRRGTRGNWRELRSIH